MAKTTVYNQDGSKKDELELSDAVFSVAAKSALVHQVYVALEANRRQPWAHTKDRSEVRGGGKKPWKQKGTGRARHGSRRSPIWSGGGITFGPRNDRNFTKKTNKKMRRKALLMCLSDKVADQRFIVLNELPASGKTKDFAALQKTLPCKEYSTLIITDGGDQKVCLGSRNINAINVQRLQDLNVADLLHHKYVVVSEHAVSAIEKMFS
tara:strand:- start:131 stop:757 length:627 start_codon:yes stop_codon:yes gene_type:complete